MHNNIFLFLGGIGMQEILFIFIIPTLLWLWAIIDLLKSDFDNNTNKLIWALVIIFAPVIGALLYLIVGRRQKVKS